MKPAKYPHLNQILKYLILGILSTIFIVFPVAAAEKIFIIYGPFKFSLGVDSIETFAYQGVVNKELDFYFRAMGLTTEQQNKIQQTLLSQYKIDPVRLWRFLKTPTGEQILERLGVLISVPGGSNGKYLLRGALIQAALDKENGLSIMNFLRYLATDVQLNTKEILQLLDRQRRVNLATNAIINDASFLSASVAAKTPTDYSKLRDIRQPGEYGVQPLEILQLKDESRNRSFYLHLYRPQKWKEGKTPVVVVSHGLSSRPEDFSLLAQQLASYGYLVAVPQHPGSDYQQFDAMLNGYSNKLYYLEDFINRPLDVSYVLDELERLNLQKFEGRLKLDRVGVLGHSFGGYTALALAGATWDFENIKTYCDRQVWEANLSMLLQCDVLNLSKQEYSFHDERVQAIGVMNPLNSVVFGAEGLRKVKIPVVIGAGTDDPATPAIIEQVRTLAWVSSPSKYLFLMVGQAHFLSPIEADSQVSNLLNTIKDFQGINPELVTLYGNTQATAFLQVYLAEDETYRVFLEPGYWQYISTESFPIYWLDSSAVMPLIDIYNRFKPADIPLLQSETIAEIKSLVKTRNSVVP